MDAQVLLERAERLKALVEADINIDLRGGGRAAMDKINPANFSNERDYAQAVAAAGNSAQADALKNLNLNDPASIAKYNTPVAQPTAAQQAEWSKDATADQKADWRYGKQGAAAAPAGTTKPAAVKDPKVLSLQQKLIALGAKIQADGIMGPQTQAAMKQYGLDANGNPVKDAKTGQPVTNDKTASAIIQRGGVAPAEITPDMISAQQARSNIEAQRANTMTPTGAPTTTRADGQEVYKTQSGKEVAVGSLTDKRNQRQAEYQAQTQAFLAKQAEEKAAKAAASGQGPTPVTATTPAAPATPAAAPATPQGQTAGGASTAYRVRTPKGAAAQNQPQESLDRILYLATYLK